MGSGHKKGRVWCHSPNPSVIPRPSSCSVEGGSGHKKGRVWCHSPNTSVIPRPSSCSVEGGSGHKTIQILELAPEVIN